MRLYMKRTGAPNDIGPMVAVKDRQNAMKNEYAHLKLADISLETVKASPMMWDPVRFLESCPSSDGACAVVFTNEEGGKAAAAWCHLARTVCRRAERDVVTLARAEAVNPQVVVYLNRLSDLLFVLARVYNNGGQDDVLWRPGQSQQPSS